MHQDNRHQNSGDNRGKSNCPDTFPDTYADTRTSPGHLYQRTTVSGVGTERQHSVRVAVLDVELPDHALHLHHLEDKPTDLI